MGVVTDMGGAYSVFSQFDTALPEDVEEFERIINEKSDEEPSYSSDGCEPTHQEIKTIKASEVDREYIEDGPLCLDGGICSHSVDTDGVNQESIDECTLMATLGAIAHVNPDAIKKMIKHNGDNSYTVAFSVNDTGSHRTVEVMVDGGFPGNNATHIFARSVDFNIEMWAMLIEKAYAQYFRGRGDGRIEDVNPEFTITRLTGQRRWDITPYQLSIAFLAELMEKKHAVTCSAFEREDCVKLPLYDYSVLDYKHAYYMTDVDVRAGTVTLKDPWQWSETGLIMSYEGFQMHFKEVSFIPTVSTAER